MFCCELDHIKHSISLWLALTFCSFYGSLNTVDHESVESWESVNIRYCGSADLNTHVSGCILWYTGNPNWQRLCTKFKIPIAITNDYDFPFIQFMIWYFRLYSENLVEICIFSYTVTMAINSELNKITLAVTRINHVSMIQYIMPILALPNGIKRHVYQILW